MLQTIMVADDSISLHALIRMQLEADCLNIQSVYDGDAAVSQAAALKPDLILLDIDMPRMDGFEACRKIKADSATHSIPVIFLSADSIAADKDKGLGLGAVGYIVKPFKPEELISQVRATLRPHSVCADAKMVDALTGVGNRQFFEQSLKEKTARAKATGNPLSCTVIEIDQLGLIACKCGTPVANQVARGIAGILSSNVAANSAVICLPDRRFAILSTDTDRFDAVAQAAQIKQAVEQKSVAHHGNLINITCSFGVCDLEIASPETLLERASQVLARAVDRGGNRVSMARVLPKPALNA